MSSRYLRSDSALTQDDLILLHDATLSMKRDIPVPPQAQNRYYSASCGRRPHLMGAFPDVAFIFAANGAGFPDVCQPMTTLRALIWNRFYLDRLPSLHDAMQAETEAQGRLDVWQLIVSENPSPENCKAMQHSLNAHIGTLRVLRAVTESLSRSTRR